jgi:hypothetical protein
MGRAEIVVSQGDPPMQIPLGVLLEAYESPVRCGASSLVCLVCKCCVQMQVRKRQSCPNVHERF